MLNLITKGFDRIVQLPLIHQSASTMIVRVSLKNSFLKYVYSPNGEHFPSSEFIRHFTANFFDLFHCMFYLPFFDWTFRSQFTYRVMIWFDLIKNCNLLEQCLNTTVWNNITMHLHNFSLQCKFEMVLNPCAKKTSGWLLNNSESLKIIPADTNTFMCNVIVNQQLSIHRHYYQCNIKVILKLSRSNICIREFNNEVRYSSVLFCYLSFDFQRIRVRSIECNNIRFKAT